MPYIKQVFDVTTFDQAKHVVLTSDPNNPNKFDNETNYLIEQIAESITINDTDTVLDFGCGMGRVSKKLIEQFNCNVLAMDISESMKTFATLYVSNPTKFKTTVEQPEANSIDVAMAILVLQHVENPKQEIENIVTALKPNGYFILLNESSRLIPSDIDRNNYIIWGNDDFDVFGEVEKHLTKIKSIPYINSDKHINIYKKESK
jgi:cyclopropane fatty-acyl-phospholipid synthase-like methyltransferase